MESLNIKGFRSIKDSGEIELKPITAVIGKNSCGKSSFIRFFPLLKQSTEREISDTLLWYGDYVDFGDFSRIKHNFSENLPTSFEFKITLQEKNRYFYLFDINNSHKKIDVTVNFTVSEKHINYMSIQYLQQIIEIYMNENKTVEKILINNSSDYIKINNYAWNRESRCLLPVIRNAKSKQSGYMSFWDNNDTLKDILKILKKLVDDKEEVNISNLTNNLISVQSKEELKNQLCKLKKPKSISNFFQTEESKNVLEQINTYVVLGTMTSLIRTINYYLSEELQNVHYLKPIRASVNRYYRIQGLNINHVDADGSNLAMILYNLLDDEREMFEKWTAKNFDIKFSVSKESGHASLIIKDKDNTEINLADTGYGYSQILPIIVELWLLLKKSDDKSYKTITLVIEQPELHLHPAFQAKVIDLFANIINEAKSNKINIKIIFETHSETMINRLGFLINETLLNIEDVNVLAFSKTDTETTITPMSFNEEGLMENWPVGFFSVEE